MNPLRYFNTWLGLGLLLVTADAWFSLAPSPAGISSVPDKLGHLLMYAVLAFWFSTLYPQAVHRVFIGLVALGGLLEILQGLGTVRHAEWLDLGADAIGCALGCLLVRVLPFNAFHRFEQKLLARAP